MLEALQAIAVDLPLIFPLHPRAALMLKNFGFERYLKRGGKVEGLWATEPLGYLAFLHLMLGARLVLTDSGGIQEETTALGVPCLTLRDNTERPITCTIGTNRLVGSRKEAIVGAAEEVLGNPPPPAQIPEKWDGRSAERLVSVLIDSFRCG